MQFPIVILDAQEAVELLDPSATSGFFHVRTLEGEEGWVGSQFLEVRGIGASPP